MTDGRLVISGLTNKVVSAKLLADGTKLKTSSSKDGSLTVMVPPKSPDPIATVIKVEVKGKVVPKNK